MFLHLLFHFSPTIKKINGAKDVSCRKTININRYLL